MRRILSVLCPLAGTVLLIAGFTLGTRAAHAAAGTLEELKARIKDEDISPGVSDMPVVEIGGYAYIGYLSIPDIGREMPMMADLTGKKLKVSPCRYYGSIRSEDMVPAAHNYPGFLGHLKGLSVGAELSFTGADGQTHCYVAADIYILPSSAVKEMTSCEYPLTLFTCAEDEDNRLTVRCDAAGSEQGV